VDAIEAVVRPGIQGLDADAAGDLSVIGKKRGAARVAVRLRVNGVDVPSNLLDFQVVVPSLEFKPEAPKERVELREETPGVSVSARDDQGGDVPLRRYCGRSSIRPSSG
jgi:hypothetical protein